LHELESMYRGKGATQAQRQTQAINLTVVLEFAEGGVGVICSGNIPIDRDYLEKEGNAILDRRNSWDAVEAFRPCVAAAKSRKALFLAQPQHPGRQCPASISLSPVSASNVQLQPCMNKTYAKHRSLTCQEIKSIAERDARAAETSYEAGADGIVLHACHNYLISQFSRR
jgi:2,4-dienoyl-CoA reductase-like NADH-dependent reductase (Old Yellow Enzyme family)